MGAANPASGIVKLFEITTELTGVDEKDISDNQFMVPKAGKEHSAHHDKLHCGVGRDKRTTIAESFERENHRLNPGRATSELLRINDG